MTNTVFHTEDPKILQRQLAELELRLSTALARLEQRSAKQLRLIRVEGGVTHDAQLDTFVRVDPGTATTTVVLPQPTANMCNRGLAVLHVGTTGTVRVMAREGEVANASYVDVPDDALYTFLCDGSAWWAQKQNVVSITDGPGIDVTYDGAGNVTISNDGVLSVTGGDGCSNTGTAANPIITVNVDGTTIDTASDAITLGTVPLDHIDATSADHGEVITRWSGSTEWVPLGNRAGGYTHPKCDYALFVNVDVSSPSPSYQGIKLSSSQEYLLLGQVDAKQNGPWEFNGMGAAMTRPSHWSGTLNADIGHVIYARVSGFQGEVRFMDEGAYAGTGSVPFILNNTGSFVVGTSTPTFRPGLATGALVTVWHADVQVAVAYNVDITNPPGTMEGVILTSGYSEVLLTRQITEEENGPYVFNGAGSAMTRRTDFPYYMWLPSYISHQWPVRAGQRIGSGEIWQCFMGTTADSYVGVTDQLVWRCVGNGRMGFGGSDHLIYTDKGGDVIFKQMDWTSWTSKNVARIGASGFYLYDPTVGESDTNYANLELDLSSDRVRFSIYGDRSLTYGAAITVTGVDDGSYPDQVRFMNSAGLAWRIESTGNLLPASNSRSLGKAGTPAKIFAGPLILDRGDDLTISAGGSITVTHSWHRVGSYGGAATDNLDTIRAGTDGQLLFLSAASNSQDITLRNGVDNIETYTEAVLVNQSCFVILIYDGAHGKWCHIPRFG